MLSLIQTETYNGKPVVVWRMSGDVAETYAEEIHAHLNPRDAGFQEDALDLARAAERLRRDEDGFTLSTDLPLEESS
jgi:hypothetical protein